MNRELVNKMPGRWKKTSFSTTIILVLVATLLVHGLQRSELTITRLTDGIWRLGDFITQAFPPDFSRITNILIASFETFEIALIGTIFGALLSVPLGVLAARNTTPHKSVYFIARGIISFLRAIPDLVWGLIFVVTIGLGPAPGIFAITVDVIGFCGRFFAERIEEIDSGPMDSLKVSGASKLAIVTGAILPATLPSFIATCLFSLEQSVRSAIILGLVGAGGIGVELQTSMQLFRFKEALTIILIIFAIVLGVERVSAYFRSKII
ncbi:phosphonate ABC transporter, permease protein PhnE [Gracilibacillus sp. YIM 98692]|uniref:phosphonate ABC transporter, permease protein PhnE n=1 Tax=Gracilibacillus sp. YIM 98692 TaxID=2663532 RepID=UPI001F08CDEE|nr:phosphonate ABC transporter, permease protein PhnE [Gracilibacillus sp. YIM 98692]